METDEKYRALIALPRPVSKTHAPMPLGDRAAQFAPFAALNGHNDSINERARTTSPLFDHDEDKICETDRRLRLLLSNAKEHPSVSLLYFLPDEKKDGGAYVHFQGTLKQIDEYERVLIFTDSSKIKIDMICEIFDT